MNKLFPRPEYWMLFLLLALTSLWTIEVAFIQETTLEPRFIHWFSWIGKHAIRWTISFCVILIFLCAFRKWMVAILMGLHVIFSLVLVTYYDYFGTQLSEQVILTQSGEGAEFTGYALSLIDVRLVLSLLVLFFIKLFFLKKLSFDAAFKKIRNTCLCFASALLPLSVFASILLADGHPKKTITFHGWHVYAHTYGYLPAWGLNYYYLGSDKAILAHALENIEPITESRLTDLAMALPKVKNISIIQVESLDYNVIFQDRPDGSPAMPFIRSIIPSSLVYKLNQDRRFGTATADFTMGAGLMPKGSRLPYKVPGFSFEPIHTLARLASEKGFNTHVLHGNYGSFFNRKPSFKEMGFDGVFFYEDIIKENVAPYKKYIQDDALLEFARTKLGDEKNLQFIITVTSHGPWNMTPSYPYETPSENRSTPREHYINSIGYVDYSIMKHIASSDEDTLYIIYGDHSSGTDSSGTDADLVPCIIYYKNDNIRNVYNDSHTEKILDFYEVAGFVFKYLQNL